MNLIDPEDLMKAAKPVLDELEVKIENALQRVIDRIDGAKITVTIELPAKPTT